MKHSKMFKTKDRHYVSLFNKENLMSKKNTILTNVTKSMKNTILTKTGKLALGAVALWGLIACECPADNPAGPDKDKEAPVITNHTFMVDENVPNGTEVGQVMATDNVGVTAYNITDGNVGNAFSIDNNGFLTTAGAIDYENISNYRLTVRASDAGGNGSNASVTISVIDIMDEEPPMISNHMFSIAENVSNGVQVGQVMANDNVGVTAYRIISGNTNDAFSIDNSGFLTALGATNYEHVPSYTLMVRAFDAASNSDTAPITIMVEFDDFYLHANGVTVLCPDAGDGMSGLVNGAEYTKRGRGDITNNHNYAATSCTSGITNMSLMFLNASSFNGDISDWDTSKVTDMRWMFEGADAFNGDISDWDTSKVTDMRSMFYSADAFNGDISDWDTSKVTDMWAMFEGAAAFNGDISGWCVSNIATQPNRFAGGSGLTNTNYHPVWGMCPTNN